jgi:hypothetical protein
MTPGTGYRSPAAPRLEAATWPLASKCLQLERCSRPSCRWSRTQSCREGTAILLQPDAITEKLRHGKNSSGSHRQRTVVPGRGDSLGSAASTSLSLSATANSNSCCRSAVLTAHIRPSPLDPGLCNGAGEAAPATSGYGQPKSHLTIRSTMPGSCEGGW